MPGILPMKMIQLGSASQARVAQACDRCRSKKIRCDGKRPSCTQCVSVGFECKTSDKLSRRAFPRGYTESLEERVRSLEAETRELKDLLDEKDEKIDLLSKNPSRSPQPGSKRPSASSSPVPSIEQQQEKSEEDECFVLEPTSSFSSDGAVGLVSALSRGQCLVDTFKTKAQLSGKIIENVDTDLFFQSHQMQPLRTLIAPSRMLSDQLINIFFQEWAALFPILHRPTFLSLYAKYVAEPDQITDSISIAQLNLVFGIAALSSPLCPELQISSFESHWRSVMDSILTGHTISELQCLILASIYCMMRGDYDRLQAYKSVATSIAMRLGLHISQKPLNLTPLLSETRKRVFWTLYTIDAFSAAQSGLPMLLVDDEISCELPVDTDDEYLSDSGFLPTLPGESTKVSSALALFRLARVLAGVLSQVYAPKPSHELSFSVLSNLSDVLEQWNSNLAPHLRLKFTQGKPSSTMTSSRSPVLSLAYYYVRSLIQRPAILSNLGEMSSSSVLALADSSKHMLQITKLLNERGLSFAFCISKQDILTLSGFGLLFQIFEADQEGRLIQECQKSVINIVGLTASCSAHTATGLGRIARSLFPSTKDARKSQEIQKPSPRRKQVKTVAHRFSSDQNSGSGRSLKKESSVSSIQSEPISPTALPLNQWSISQPQLTKSPTSAPQSTEPEYMGLSAEELTQIYRVQDPARVKQEYSLTRNDWERLLSNLDQDQTNIIDSIYGGQPSAMPVNFGHSPLSQSSGATHGSDSTLAWSNAEAWNTTQGQDNMDISIAQSQSIASFEDNCVATQNLPDFTDMNNFNSMMNNPASDHSQQFLGNGYAAIVPLHSSPEVVGFTNAFNDGFVF